MAASNDQALAARLKQAIQYQQTGQLTEAQAAYHQLLQQHPDNADALHGLGTLMCQLARWPEAADLIRRAVAQRPHSARYHLNLGTALHGAGQSDEAIIAYRRAIELKPAYPQACNNLGQLLQNQGDMDGAIGCFDRALASSPNDPVCASNRLFALQFQSRLTPDELLTEHRAWDRQFAAPFSSGVPIFKSERSPDRRLRIGYISGDFRRHSVAYFLDPLLVHHDRSQVEIFCYSNTQIADEITARLRGHCDCWRDISGVNDDTAAQRVREDRIDVLVDLAGHTARNRLLVLARKPAPIQMTFLGYPATTGLSAIDYRLTDALADPVNQTDAFCTETLIRLPTCAWCFQPLDPVEPTPQQHPAITFGSFNALAKLSPYILDLWAKLLVRIPESRLLLKSRQLGHRQVQQQLLSVIKRHGIAEQRIDLLESTADERQHLEIYNRMDIALDTFPYHGTTTTCQALWMGVPVISLAGRTHVSRVGVSLLHNAGLDDWVAQTPEEYIEIAARWANDSPRLATLRAGLRQRMLASPLMNAPRYASDIEAAYRSMWTHWLNSTA